MQTSVVEIRPVESNTPQPPAKLEVRSLLFSRPAGWTICLAFLLAIAVLRIVSTYHVFNHTIDEPSHIAGGIEWWEKGTYTLEPKHTPLARISVALGPYLAGVRGNGATVWYETYPILSENGRYWLNLTLGRIGVLPYFMIATVVVFLWTKRLVGAPAGIVAAAIFTQLPVILAHSSVATTDIPLTAMFCWCLYAFTSWLRDPNPRTAALFGIATGLSVCTKLSTVVFLPACALPVLIMYAAGGRQPWRKLLRTAAIVALCAFFATWAIYRFSHRPLAQATKFPDRVAAKVFGPSSRSAEIIHRVATHIPVPAPELFDGIRMLRRQNKEGTRAYLFGRVKDGGWWYFFFVAVALKTPLAVLLLAALGSVLVARRYWRNRSDWEIAVPLVSAAMLLICTMPAHLDSGVRYVLPIFVLLSILAAAGLVTLWTQINQRSMYRAAAIGMFGWLAVSSAWAHPDYLSYFNELGGRDPSRYIVVGDLDWGQDLTRLSVYLRQHSIAHVSIAYDAYFDPAPLGFPETERIQCNARPPSGWVAIDLRRSKVHSECYPWLAGQRPIARVGKTISVYYRQGP